MIITKKHLPRRTILRGMGATLALPFLDSMVPALSAGSMTAAAPVRRLGVVYVPNGIYMDRWTPAGDGTALEITPTLEPLAPFRQQMIMLSGLSALEGLRAPGEAGGDHARAAGAYLTGAHPKKTEGADIRAGVSMDQIAAQTLGKETQLASLEISLEHTDRAGACDPGYSCAYANTLCWSTPTTPLPMENNPRMVFERLFGATDSIDSATRLARVQEDRSILDAVTQKTARLQRELGPSDLSKLDQYLSAIRDLERRLQIVEAQSDKELPVVAQPMGIPATFEEHTKVMFDLQVLAYQADLTRVITYMVGRETSNRAYPEIGVPEPHHVLSHHGKDARAIAQLIQIDAYNTEMLAYYLEKLASTPDGEGSLLDHLSIIYGSGLSDGNSHNHHHLPTLLIGGGAGRIKGGRHLRFAEDTPITNLFVTVLDSLGVPVEKFGDSTGRLLTLSDVYQGA